MGIPSGPAGISAILPEGFSLEGISSPRKVKWNLYF
jgi:hypothetical protein